MNQSKQPGLPRHAGTIKQICRILSVLFFLSVFVTFSFAADKTGVRKEVRSLVTKVVSAYGGKGAIEGIKTVYALGDIDAFMRHDHGTYELCFRRSRMLRVETKYDKSRETRILRGDVGYRGMDGPPLARAEGDSLLAIMYQYKHFDLPYGLLKDRYSISLKGGEDLNGNPVVVLHLTDSEGPPMDVYIDTHTFFIVKVTGYFRMPDGRSTALSALFSDFRKVGDIMFPFRITNYAGGYKIASIKMKFYRINPPIPDSLFSP